MFKQNRSRSRKSKEIKYKHNQIKERTLSSIRSDDGLSAIEPQAQSPPRLTEMLKTKKKIVLPAVKPDQKLDTSASVKPIRQGYVPYHFKHLGPQYKHLPKKTHGGLKVNRFAVVDQNQEVLKQTFGSDEAAQTSPQFMPQIYETVRQVTNTNFQKTQGYATSESPNSHISIGDGHSPVKQKRFGLTGSQVVALYNDSRIPQVPEDQTVETKEDINTNSAYKNRLSPDGRANLLQANVHVTHHKPTGPVKKIKTDIRRLIRAASTRDI